MRDARSSGSRSRRAGTRAATSGSAPAARRRSVTAATTRKASASADRAARARPSRSGSGATTATSTTTSSSARATSRSRCASCAASRARAPRTSSTSTARSSATARNAGLLDLKFQPERHNAVKVLLFFDVGGSMESHVRVCEELFSAARSEFKHLEYFYFHNFIYESVWKDSRRRHGERTPTVRDPAQVPAGLPRRSSSATRA